MDRNKLITHILHNIAELQSLTKGMESMADVPQFLHSLALEKVDNLKSAFLDLSVAKENNEETEQKVVDSPLVADVQDVKEEEVVKVQTEDEHVDEFQQVLSELNKEEIDDEEKEEEIAVEPEVVPPSKTTEEESVKNPSSEVKDAVKPAKTNDTPRSGLRGFGFGRSIEGRFVKDLKKALNINDRIRYSKQLFGGDSELMKKTIERLDVCLSLDEALEYVSQFGWNENNEAVADFIALLERRFSN